MGKLKDLKRKRFGRLLVVKRGGNDNRGNSRWVCLCDCGQETTVRGIELSAGKTKSCGCYQRERASKTRTTHGMTNTPEFNTWLKMKARCHVESDNQYKNYGARGIFVCQSWRDSFEAFYSDMGPRPGADYSMDRIDNNDGYSANNCRWATREEQANNKRTNTVICYQGEEKTISQWARVLGVPMTRLWRRIFTCGWPIERAFTEPVNSRFIPLKYRNIPNEGANQ